MTKTEICNRALAILGHDRTITDYDTDTSTEAVRCRQFFDAAKENCLAEHDWDFAAVEKKIGSIHPDDTGWSRIQVPADAIRIVNVTDSDGNPFKTKRNRDYLAVQNGGAFCVLRYVSRDVDESELPHKFTEAFIYQLAALICGPMYGDDKKAEGYMNLAMQRLSDAVTKETDETAYRGEWDNPFIKARR